MLYFACIVGFKYTPDAAPRLARVKRDEVLISISIKYQYIEPIVLCACSIMLLCRRERQCKRNMGIHRRRHTLIGARLCLPVSRSIWSQLVHLMCNLLIGRAALVGSVTGRQSSVCWTPARADRREAWNRGPDLEWVLTNPLALTM